MAIYNGHFEDANGNILLPINSGEVSAVENGVVASRAYTKGTYLFFNNKVCKATTNITSGSTLAIGTNLLHVTLCGEMTAHLVASNGTEFTLQNLKDGVYN